MAGVRGAGLEVAGQVGQSTRSTNNIDFDMDCVT